MGVFPRGTRERERDVAREREKDREEERGSERERKKERERESERESEQKRDRERERPQLGSEVLDSLCLRQIREELLREDRELVKDLGFQIWVKYLGLRVSG